MKYDVTVARTAVRLFRCEVTADSEEAAMEAALDMAGDHDFSGVNECGVEYEVYTWAPKEDTDD